MSGFEVVGVVLGVLPLIISGLEHYADGVRVIKVIASASGEFETLARKLRAEEVVYRNTLAILLDDYPLLQKSLKQRLQHSYESFEEHVSNIHTALKGFRDRLHIDSNGKGPFDDARSFRQAYRRFHFALQKSAYLDLIQEIKNDNTHIHRLLKQSKTLVKARKRRLPDYTSAQTSARSIFEILQHGLHVSCGAPHKASIYLRPAGERENDFDVALREADDTFRTVLHHDVKNPLSKHGAPPWSIQEAEMRLLDSIASSGATSSPPAALATRKRKVQFVDPPQLGRSNTARSAATPQLQLKEIRDLCHSIDRMRSMQCGICLGYIMGMSNQHRHGLYWPKDRLINTSSLTVSTLGNVLKEQGKGGCKLTNADVHRLAVPLASWMLRLHDTPWLMSTWSKDDITLIQENGKILTKHAFITQSLQASSALPAQCSSGSKTKTMIFIRNPTLFALGVILIELCMGESIDELHLADELNTDGSKHELSDFYTAARLLEMEEISDRFGQRWSDVVRRCIYCDLNQSKVSLEDNSFRSAVHNDIVAELEEDYRTFFHL